MNDKVISGVLGFAVGDALGVPVEFCSREMLTKNPLKEMIGYGSHKVPEGTWSDDTSLMIATMDSINNKYNIDYIDIMNNFCEWFCNSKYTATDKLFDIGISTQKAIYNYIHGNYDVLKCGATDFYENGNGSLMRMLPIAFYIYSKKLNDEDKNEIIGNVSSLTHGHEISKLGCNIFCDYVINILQGKSKDLALEELGKIDYKRYYSQAAIKLYDKILSGKIKDESINNIKSTGFVVDSLEASIWCTLKSNNYEESVLKAVNLGEDTDTIAAITGGINGIIYGKNCIPKKWLMKLKKLDYLVLISEQYSNTIENKMQKNMKF